MVTSISSNLAFVNGRQFSAYLGLGPKQYSSGGMTVLIGISRYASNILNIPAAKTSCTGHSQDALYLIQLKVFFIHSHTMTGVSIVEHKQERQLVERHTELA